MWSFDSPWIAAGPMLQVIRGFVIALVLWPFNYIFLYQKNGWLKLWALLVGLSVLSTAAAPGGSIEGFIYTSIPILEQIKGYIEVVPQIGLFAFFLCYWYQKPTSAWNVVGGILVGLIVFMSTMGILAASGIVHVA